jgi:hypothetical protein
VRARSLIAAVLAAIAITAPAASAAVPLPDPFVTAEGFNGDLQVVEDGTAWNDSRCVRGCAPFGFGTTDLARFLLKRPDARPVELARSRLTNIPGGSNSIIEIVSFAASATRTVMVEADEENQGDQLSSEARIFGGARGAPPPELVRCQEAFFLPFALDGDNLAFDETRCVSGSTDVVVRSLADGSVRRVSVAGRLVESLSLAGDRLGILSYPRTPEGSPPPETGEVAVWDLTTGTKVGSVTVQQSVVPPVFDVRADGTLALVTFPEAVQPESCVGLLSLLRPGDPSPTALATTVCNRVAFAGEEVLFERRQRLLAIPLGGAERSLLRLDGVALLDAAAEGSRVAYALLTCSGDTTIHLVELSADEAIAGSTACPFRIASRRARVAPNRRLRIRLRCRRGCAGQMSLRVSGRTVAEAGFERRAGRSSVRLRLPRALMRRLRREGFLRGRVIVSTTDRSGKVNDRRRTVTLFL